MATANLLFWLTNASFARSHGSSASIRGPLFCCRTIRRSSALRPRMSFNGIELGNQLKRFAGGWRRPGRCQFIETAPDVGPAEGKPDVVAPGKLTVTGITVDLQDSREALVNQIIFAGNLRRRCRL